MGIFLTFSRQTQITWWRTSQIEIDTVFAEASPDGVRPIVIDGWFDFGQTKIIQFLKLTSGSVSSRTFYRDSEKLQH